MTVYLDGVFVLNYLFDFILLNSVNYILRRNVKLLRIVLGSLVGSTTIFILFFNINNIVLFIIKIFISILMILISFNYRDFNYFKKNIIYFYLVSMLLGGSIYFLKSQLSYSNKGLVFYDNGLGISYGIVLLISILLYFKYVKGFKLLKNHYSNYFKCNIFVDDNKVISLNGFLDTGNKLVDPYSNKSIILVNRKMVSDINIRSPIYVPFNSLNNHGLLMCFKVNKIVIDGKENDNFLVGISDNDFFIDGIDCILNNKLMEGLR